jgi:hypothetical protein
MWKRVASLASLDRELSSPLVVLSQGVLDLPTWLMSLLGPSGSTLVVMLPENPVRLVALLIACRSQRH